MKLSTFLFKTLKSFNNGKSYSSTPTFECSQGFKNCSYHQPLVGGKNQNLIGQLDRMDKKLGVKLSNKAQASIAKSLGHTNVAGFQTKGFSKVRDVVKAAIKRERAAGN